MKYILPVILCLIFMSFHPSSTKADDGRFLDIVEITSAKGIKAWLVKDDLAPVISVQFAFRGGGALDPDDKSGLSNMVASTIDEGAGPYDSASFQKMLDDHSITLSYNAGRDGFYGSLKTLTAKQDIAFKLAKLSLTEPRFEDDAIDRMRKANISGLRYQSSQPSWIAARIQNDILHKNHPYQHNTGGSFTSLAAITRDDLQRYVGTRFTRDRLLVAICGDIDEETAKHMLDTVFGDLPQSSALPQLDDAPLHGLGKTYLYATPIPQTIIRINWPGIQRENPLWWPMQVMNQILGAGGFGSRLMEELREERGLTYGAYSDHTAMEHAAYFTISASTANENAAKALALIHDEVDKIRTEIVSEEELQDAKSYMIGSLPLSFSSTNAIASIMLSLQFDHLSVDYLDTRADHIEQVNREEIRKIAHHIFQPDAATVLVGMPQDLTADELITDIPGIQ